MSVADAENPLLQTWSTPYQAPPFATILPEHYEPAFKAGMEKQKAAVDAIVGNSEAPTFENTIVAMERADRLLSSISKVFFGVASANTNPEIQAVEREIAPLLSRHSDAIYLNRLLYDRIDNLWQRRETLGLDKEGQRLLERYHIAFSRSGAGLDPKDKRRLSTINERLATLGTQFGQNVLADEASWQLVLEDENDLEGLPDWARAAAAKAAEDRDLPGKYVITLARSSVETFLQFSKKRELREKAFNAWISRGENGGESDNRAVASEIIALRSERAKLLGHDTFSRFRLEDSMAKTPEAVDDLLQAVWKPGKALAQKEAEALQGLIAEDGGNFKLTAADWRHYADRLRKQRFDYDESELKPYLQLDKMIEAAFWTAGKLFGLNFKPAPDAPVYHPDVRAWEARDRDGRFVGLFLGDYFARPSKRSGAWAGNYRSQGKIDGDVRPIIVNVMNFSKPPAGQPALLSFDDVRTLFHEFGHALHGLLSDVTYPTLSGTAVAIDFVELPSQLYEHWMEQPEVLRQFAVHHETGETIPDELIEKVLSAGTFNQGFATVEYTASALVDLDLHDAAEAEDIDISAFEKATLDRIGMPEAMAMRHRPPHFLHIFSGSFYASAYYAYLWAEVLDADAFAAFEETGDAFDPETAKRLHDYVYAAGNTRGPAEAYKLFRGRMPTPDALLKKRGLDQVA